MKDKVNILAIFPGCDVYYLLPHGRELDYHLLPYGRQLSNVSWGEWAQLELTDT